MDPGLVTEVDTCLVNCTKPRGVAVAVVVKVGVAVAVGVTVGVWVFVGVIV